MRARSWLHVRRGACIDRAVSATHASLTRVWSSLLCSVVARAVVEANKRQRGELYKSIDADYYGYRDDDDGLLEKLEKKQQDKSAFT